MRREHRGLIAIGVMLGLLAFVHTDQLNQYDSETTCVQPACVQTIRRLEAEILAHQSTITELVAELESYRRRERKLKALSFSRNPKEALHGQMNAVKTNPPGMLQESLQESHPSLHGICCIREASLRVRNISGNFLPFAQRFIADAFSKSSSRTLLAENNSTSESNSTSHPGAVVLPAAPVALTVVHA